MLTVLIVNYKVWQKILQAFWNLLFSRRVTLLYFWLLSVECARLCGISERARGLITLVHFYAGFNPVILIQHFSSAFVLGGSVAKTAFATEKGTFSVKTFFYYWNKKQRFGGQLVLKLILLGICKIEKIFYMACMGITKLNGLDYDSLFAAECRML
jgi:hypothetical protein